MKQAWWLIFALAVSSVNAEDFSAESFSFDISQYERKTWELSGYLQGTAQTLQPNQQSLFSELSASQTAYQRYLAELELSGLYRWQTTTLYALAKIQTLHQPTLTDNQTETDADFYQLYLHYQPNQNWQFELGQRALRWGRGYAFNPVAVLERPKDALDPDLAREGFVLANAEWVKSFADWGSVSLTAVVLPVSEDLNAEFGQKQTWNNALKFSWQFGKTDLDWIWRSDGSRPEAFGFAFSHSLAVNFALHGEALWLQRSLILVDSNGVMSQQTKTGADILLGLRYLTNQETTWIAELYHQANAYTSGQMTDFYAYAETASPIALQNLISRSRYLAPQAMQNYLSVKVSQKEPWNWLYWTVGLGLITNVEDRSSIVTPEIIYSGLMNWEGRMRLNYFVGDDLSEYGERQNAWRAEVQIRYHF